MKITFFQDGITHPTNSSLRDFSGECIKEFIKWTIKHSDEDALSRDPINIKVFVKKMKFFSTHPHNAKKLGCALIFNNIYRELREEDALINIFWLEILHIFVNSLATFEDIVEYNESKTVEQTKNALKHLQRVFIQKASIFRTTDSKRRVPNDLNQGLLKDVSAWLLQQTGSKSKYCRECCMEMFLNITPLVNGKQLKLQIFIQQNFPKSVLTIYEKQLFEYPKKNSIIIEDYSDIFLWMKLFLCSLDGYNFVLKNNLEDVSFNQSLFFSQLHLFLTNLQDIDFVGALNLITRKTWNYTLKDKELFINLKSACILAVLKLYNTVVQDNILVKKADTMFHNGFWKLIINIVFQPYSLDINAISKLKFEEILNILLKGLANKLPDAHLQEFTQHLVSYLRDRKIVINDFKDGIGHIERNFLSGLLVLNNFEIEKECTTTIRNFSNGLINKIMENFYKNANDNKILISTFRQTTFEYIDGIFKFSLNNKKEFSCFLNHLVGPYVVHNAEYTEEVMFGIYILNRFPDTLVPFLINDFDTFLDFAVKKGDMLRTMELIIFVLKYLIKEKMLKPKYNHISLSLMKQWKIFENYFNSNCNNISKGIEYVKFMLQLGTLDHSEIFNWLISCLLQQEAGTNDFDMFELLVLIANEELSNSK